MNLMRRFDRPAALVSYMLSRANGGKGEMSDFLPWPREEISADEALWRGL